MSAFAPADWSDFFVAQVGAAAALTGLVIVAISINLSVILKNPLLPGRAAETVALLSGVLLLSTFALVPGQPLWMLGLELIAVAVGESVVAWLILHRARHHRHPQEARWLRRLFAAAAVLPMAAGGVSLLVGTGGGLYWLVPAVAVSLMGGIVNTWILLVEILR